MVKSKRVLVHLTANAYGGVETHVYYLSLVLATRGAKVTLASHRQLALNPDWTRSLVQAGVRMIPPPKLAQRLPGGLALVPAQFALMRDLPAHAFDCVIGQCHGGAYRLMKRFMRPGGLFLWHEYWYGVPTHGDAYTEYAVPAPSRFDQKMLTMVSELDGIVTGCERARRNLINVQGARAPIRIIPPLTFLENVPQAQDRTYTKDSMLHLAMVGRMGFGKGVLSLLQVWRELTIGNAELDFWGPISDEFRARIQPYLDDPQIHLHGSFDRSDLPQILNSADIGLMLSIEEGYGLAAWEYMACGLPFVMTDCGAVDEFTHENPDGIKIPVSLGGIRQGIEEMVYRIRTGQVSRQRLQQFHQNRFAYETNVVEHLRSLFEPEDYWGNHRIS